MRGHDTDTVPWRRNADRKWRVFGVTGKEGGFAGWRLAVGALCSGEVVSGRFGINFLMEMLVTWY